MYIKVAVPCAWGLLVGADRAQQLVATDARSPQQCMILQGKKNSYRPQHGPSPPLTYAEVLERLTATHPRSGAAMSSTDLHAMQVMLRKVSRVIVDIHDAANEARGVASSGATYAKQTQLYFTHTPQDLFHAGSSYGEFAPRKIQAFMQLLTRIHAGQRKLMRVKYAHVSHFVTMTQNIRSTRKALLDDVDDYSAQLRQHEQTLASSSREIDSLHLSANQLRTAHAELTAQLADFAARARAAKVRLNAA
jgi:hypothetical protein